MPSTTPRHFLADDDLSPGELGLVVADAARRKAERARAHHTGSPADRLLDGRVVAVVFEKPSTRTRISFEVGIVELGGHPMVIDASTTQLGRGEPLEDFARVLDRQVAALVIRTFGQERVDALASVSAVPVVNALTDLYHPCQALADLLTVTEHKGSPAGRTLTYVGDGNNVAHSLLLAGAAAGMHVRVAAPEGFQPDPAVVERAGRIAAGTEGSVSVTDDRLAACKDADVLYTDVWASMGQEDEAARRRSAFQGWSVDEAAVDAADDDCIVMHCLPAHRGEEIAGSVIDGPHSVVWDQAENRLHAQKALLAFLLART